MSIIYHPILSAIQEIEEAVKIINETLNGTGCTFKEDTEGRYHSIAFANSKEGDDSLIILAANDFAYYHSVELMFHGVMFKNIPENATWWDHWTKDQIEVDEYPEAMFEFTFNNTSDGKRRYYVVAESFSYYIGSVSHRL